MNRRIKALWVPGLVSLTGSMAWMLILQQSIPPSQRPLNHAGLPLMYQLLWLANLPLFGAVSACLSRRAGGSRSVVFTAVLFPSIVMIPLWVTLATRMSHPSPRQFFGLFCGVLNWIVLPGVALFLGAVPFLKTQPGKDKKEAMNLRTRTFWLPALASLAMAMACLTVSTLAALQPRGWATWVAYLPWLLTLPFCGAAGAYLSRRAGGKRHACLAASLFPVIAATSLVGFLALIGKFVLARPQWLYFSIALLVGVILPSMALLLGAVPAMRHPRLRES